MTDGGAFTDELVAWARADARVRDLVATLPPLAAARGDGLFVDASRAPWSSVRGELRVSVLRVMSVPRAGARPVRVGQVHATETTHPTLRFRRLRLVLHDASTGTLVEVPDPDAWWLRVLDRHYALGGAPVLVTRDVPSA